MISSQSTGNRVKFSEQDSLPRFNLIDLVYVSCSSYRLYLRKKQVDSPEPSAPTSEPDVVEEDDSIYRDVFVQVQNDRCGWIGL